MDKLIKALILAACTVLALGLLPYSFPDGALSLIVITCAAAPTVFLIRRYAGEETEFLTLVFFAALFLRIALGLVIDIYDLRLMFGPDSMSYHGIGERYMRIWKGLPVPNDDSLAFRVKFGHLTSGWGMNYLVAYLYMVIGPSFLSSQSLCGTIGAATSPLVYLCSWKIFNNKRVSRFSALAVALFPSFIIFSSQLLKDGLIIFLLVAIMYLVIQLQKRINYLAIGVLIVALFGILSLRFYIFYMMAISVAGSFLIGLGGSVATTVRNAAIIVLVGLGLTYIGAIQSANRNFETFGNLKSVQDSREALARTADSGFGRDLDVSTTEGAISAIPIGFTYLMFAPFPWQVNKLNQTLVLPEVLVWWALIPFLISGIWYAVKHKLQSTISILLFTFMLTLAYSLFQGNVGMAYRQRTQIQVFLFIFIAVGWTLMKERLENKYAKNLRREKKIFGNRMPRNKIVT